MATEVKQRNNRALVLLGVVLALAAGALTLFVAQRNSTGSSTSVPTVKAVYSQIAIAKGTKITQDMVVLKDVNADAVGAAATDFTQVVNRFPAVDIPAGAQLQPTLLLADQGSANAAALGAQPLDIPDGHVALAIPTAWPGGDPYRNADLVAVAGLIQADDHIDILIDPKGDGTVRYGFQDVHVLRAGAAPAAGQTAPAAAPTNLVVELPRAQAEELTYLTTGKTPVSFVKFVLRPRSEYGKGYEGTDLKDATSNNPGTPTLPQPADQPVTADSFGKLFPAK